ncbi:MAG: hypothetical protein H7A25_07295 [Leptospiraceae bacterium]|nr:hypothetical protein [Leptospiraceae bacterium]
MKKILLICLLLFTGFLWAESEGPGEVQTNTGGATASAGKNANVIESEKILNELLLDINKSFQQHSKVMVMKLRVLPRNVMIYKGKAEGDSCKKNEENQEDKSNNCVVLEYFDFVDVEFGPAKGIRSKAISIFYDGSAGGDDPKAEQPRTVTKIKSKIKVDNFEKLDKKLVEIVDNAPVSGPNHDDQITVFLQNDDNPPHGTVETPQNKGLGQYKVSSIENSQTSPTRNKFKRDAYLKHLRYFERLFSKIYFYNEQYGNDSAKKHGNFMKTSLSY